MEREREGVRQRGRGEAGRKWKRSRILRLCMTLWLIVVVVVVLLLLLLPPPTPPATGIAQDVLTSVRLLDSFCYTNVFVDEGREALGVKIDKKTPKVA
jgi:hypothetical protein